MSTPQQVIQLTRHGDSIGRCTFDETNPEQGMGEVTVEVTDPEIKSEIEDYLSSNPTAISIIGGSAPEDIWQYPEAASKAIHEVALLFEGVVAEGEFTTTWQPPDDALA